MFSKYTWVFPLKNKRGVSIVHAFQKILDSLNRKPNKIWVDQGGEFYNKLFIRFLKNNKIEMYSKYNKGKSVAAERFIRTLKNKIFKCMTAISKNVYFDVLDDIVNKYNNTVHRTIKMKPIDVISDSYAEYSDRVKTSKYKKIFAKGYTRNCSEEVFVVSRIKNTGP